MTPGPGVALSLVSSVAISGGFYLQHDASSRVGPLLLRRPWRSLRVLCSSPRWLAGYLGGVAGWGLYVIALAIAPLSLVQAASAGGVAILAILTWRSGQRLRPSERLGTIAASVGLLLLAMTLSAPVSQRSISVPDVAAWVGALVAGGLGTLTALGSRLRPGAALGVTAGVLYAAGDIATKGALSPGGTWWFVPVLLGCHLGGFIALQAGFQRGSALATAGPATLLLSSVPIVAGLSLFHEGVPAGPLGIARLASFAALVVGAVLLAGATDRTGEAQETAMPQRGTRTPVPPR